MAHFSHAQPNVTVEGGAAYQSRNDQRVPGDSGDKFSISDFDEGPFAAYRIYAGYRWNQKHEIRALYAPLAFEVDGEFDRAITFQSRTFAANTDTTAFYKFNSYRLTYAYHFAPLGQWELAAGFSAKIRDAEVRLEQPGVRASKKNVGFVPLLNFQARRSLSDNWRLRFDLDGLAAPQGRAFDAGLFVERTLGHFNVYAGYRTIEGGADNDEVYNFAWIHLAALGLTYTL